MKMKMKSLVVTITSFSNVSVWAKLQLDKPSRLCQDVNGFSINVAPYSRTNRLTTWQKLASSVINHIKWSVIGRGGEVATKQSRSKALASTIEVV